jgi:hypothetical protein
LEWKLDKSKGLDSQNLEKIIASIENRKPAYLAVLLVDTLKENGWTADDIHFLGVELINEFRHSLDNSVYPGLIHF